jgi:hypothetical protein
MQGWEGDKVWPIEARVEAVRVQRSEYPGRGGGYPARQCHEWAEGKAQKSPAKRSAVAAVATAFRATNAHQRLVEDGVAPVLEDGGILRRPRGDIALAFGLKGVAAAAASLTRAGR